MKEGKMIRYFLLLSMIATLLLISYGISFAGQSSANYSIDTDVLSGGGGDCGSTNYDVFHTTGQPTAIGISTSTNYTNYAGFWYTITGGIQGQLLGDINNDGVVDISDVILDLRCALGLSIEPHQCLPCGDINGGGVVDISDVILTLRMALGLNPLQPCS